MAGVIRRGAASARGAAIAVAAIAMATAALGAACGSTGDDVDVAGGEGGGLLTGAGGAGGGSTTSRARSISNPAPGGGGGAAHRGPPGPRGRAHGFFGFEEFAGLDFVTYFYEVRDRLAAEGETMVYTPAVDPFNDSTYRGAQLADAIEQILADTGYEKVNLIGHSQGGLDARVVAHDHPEWIASVTTIATPHWGTPIADIAMKVIDDPALSDILDWILQVIGAPLYDQVGQETSLAKPMYLFSQPGIAAFNAQYTDAPGIPYLSIAGRSDYHFGGSDCAPDVELPFITDFKTVLDPVDPLLDLTEQILDGGFGDPYPNDGLVRAKDARWGQFLGCVPADHLDEIGQLFGDGAGAGNGWKYKDFYVALVAELRARGY